MRFCFIATTLLALHTPLVSAQSQPLSPQRSNCQVRQTPTTNAEAALYRHDYDNALIFFRALAPADPILSRSGIIRTLLSQNKIADAEVQAKQWVDSEPQSSFAIETMGEVLIRQGHLPEAYAAAQKANALDLCNPRAYLLEADYEELTANFGFEWEHLTTANRLAAQDPEIHSFWSNMLLSDQRIQGWRSLLEHKELLTEESRASLQARLELLDKHGPATCAIKHPPASATVAMQAVANGPGMTSGFNLEVQFAGGKHKRLNVATSVGGISLTSSAAASLGLSPDRNHVARVESLTIGKLEFEHCNVHVLNATRMPLDSDGQIGPDIFSNYLVTLDYPRSQVRLDPLPSLPNGSPQTPTLSGNMTSAVATAPTHNNRYIAPEMQSWTRIYRQGSTLFLPVRLGSHPARLFSIASAVQMMMISTFAAREVTSVHHDGEIVISSIQGTVKDELFDTGDFTFYFANRAQHVQQMIATDLTGFSHREGLEVSGLLGLEVLKREALHIDFRDNLVLFDYSKSTNP